MDNKLLIVLVETIVSDAIKNIQLREGPQGPRGLRGRDGNDFRLEDHQEQIVDLISQHIPTALNLTSEQIELLKGEQGPQGSAGRDGKDGKDFSFEEHSELITKIITDLCEELSLKFEDFTAEQIEMLRGPKGRDGKDGTDGKDFSFEDNQEKISEIIESKVPKFEDFTVDQIESIRGPKGRDGKNGRDFVFEDHEEEISQIIERAVPRFEDFTDDQIEEIRGPKGDRGASGKDGKDFSFQDSQEEINNLIVSYLNEIRDVLKLKFEDLTEEDKASLKGPRGQRGKPGRDFDLEESTPVIGQKVSEWLEDKKYDLKLKFEDLTDEEKENLKLKFEHLSPEDVLSLRGPRGQRGKMGIQGEQGPAGKDGIDGKDGRIGPQGIPGFSGKDGRNGRDGRDGIDGQDAPRIVDVKVEQNRKLQNFNLSFEFEDGTHLETSPIQLPKGDSVFYYPAGVSGGGGSGSGDSVRVKTEYITLTPEQATDKKVVLSNTPLSNPSLRPDGALSQRYGIDFVYQESDNSLSWASLGLEGFLESGESIEVSYLFKYTNA